MSKRQRNITTDTDDDEFHPNSKRLRDNDEESVPQNKKQPKVFDGKYFELVDWDEKATNIKAVCKECKREVKGQVSSTGNFYKHYRTVHKDVYHEMKADCDRRIDKENSSSTLKQKKLPFINQIDQNKVN